MESKSDQEWLQKEPQNGALLELPDVDAVEGSVDGRLTRLLLSHELRRRILLLLLGSFDLYPKDLVDLFLSQWLWSPPPANELDHTLDIADCMLSALVQEHPD